MWGAKPLPYYWACTNLFEPIGVIDLNVWCQPFSLANEHENRLLGPFGVIEPFSLVPTLPLSNGLEKSHLGPFGVIDPTIMCQSFFLAIGHAKGLSEHLESLTLFCGGNPSPY